MTDQLSQGAPAPFQIDSADRANWLVRKVVEARRYGEQVKEWAEREQRRAEREEQSLMLLYGRQLEDWTTGEIARAGGRRRSVSLPAGTVGFRTHGPKLVVDDTAVVLDWAREHCLEAIVRTERLSKAALGEAMRATGLVPPGGVHVEAAADRLTIRG